MKVHQQGAALSVGDIIELAAANSGILKSSLQALLTPSVKEVEIDLRGTEFIDCTGAGALASLRREALQHNPSLRFSIRPPRSSLRRVFALTGLDTILPAERPACAVVAEGLLGQEELAPPPVPVAPVPSSLTLGVGPSTVA